VKLEYEKITDNPGLRSLAKLMLNSFWGKFGQRENQPKTQVINNPADFFSLMSNPALDVHGIVPINDDTLLVSHELKEEAYDPLFTVNVAVASFVTAQARLKLYSYLEQLEDRVLYYDTDSVFYISRDTDTDIDTGQFIGDMTDELEDFGPGSYITHFVRGGPKNYAYKVFCSAKGEERVVCKVKGICLNYEASKSINFNSIRDMVLEKIDPIPIVSRNIRRTKEHEVITREETKLYKPNSMKRKFLDGGISVPFGFKRQKNV
jgi:hypothetical protein